MATRAHFSSRICEWISQRFGFGYDQVQQTLARTRSDWEQDASNEYELWCAQSEEARALADRAFALSETDPAAALEAYREAAEAGSVWAMEMVGAHYHHARVVPFDFAKAEHFYHRAISAGSWSAAMSYAHLLAHVGDTDRCDEMLEDGIEKDFIPAFYWLAWYRYRRSPTARTFREIRPLLERAAEAGHPGAQLTMARLMARGRFGLSRIPDGFRRLLQTAAGATTAHG